VGCGVILGALAFGEGRSFERSGGTAQPRAAAALGSPDERPGSSETASLGTAPATGDVLQGSSEPARMDERAAAWLPEIEQATGASPFSAAAPLAPSSATPSQDTAELVRATIDLLVARRFDAAVIWGRALVATEPDNALGYLCLASAQLDLGRRQEAHETFRSCVRRATRGDVSECLAFAGRR
jgi:hypothetical protein